MGHKLNLDVSIIIVSWNTRDVLHDCLDSVFQQTEGLLFEVIVVDNASTDGSAEMVRIEFPRARLIENSCNKGFAAANNQAIAVAKGRYILLLNSDTIVLDHAIDKVVAFADSRPAAEIVGCRVLNPDGTLQPTCAMFPSIWNLLLSTTYLYKLFPHNRFLGREEMKWWGGRDVRKVDVVWGCFMLVRREMIEKVGVLDEQFFMYGEETDWCYRSRNAGYKVVFTPCAEIIHLGGQSSKLAAAKMTLLRCSSRLLFFKKHKGHFEYTAACLLIALFFLLRIPYWTMRTLVSKKNKRREYFKVVYTYIIGGFCALTGGARLYQVRMKQEMV
jgi:GT2 family glycosyltransferase